MPARSMPSFGVVSTRANPTWEDIDPEALAWSLIAVVDGLGLHSAAVDLGAEYDWPAIEQSFLSIVRDGLSAPRAHPSRAK